jgi:hypothetical protein
MHTRSPHDPRSAVSAPSHRAAPATAARIFAALVALLPLPSTAAPKEEARMHRDNVNTAAVDAEGRRLLTGSTGGEVVLWQTSPMRPLVELEAAGSSGTRGRIAALALTPDGQVAAVAPDWAREVELWTLGEAPAASPLAAHSARTTALAYAPDGAMLATAGHDRAPAGAKGGEDDELPPMTAAAVRLWRDGKLLRELGGPHGRITALTFDEAGGRVAAGGEGEARVWDTATGRLTATLAASGQVATIAFAGASICVVASEGAACFEGSNRQPVAGVRAPTLAAALAGDVIAAGTFDELMVVRRTSGERLATVPGRATAVVRVGADLWALFDDRAVVLHNGIPEGVEHTLRVVSE